LPHPGAGLASGATALTGAWGRPDGAYVILIRGVAADATLDAMYFNPDPLPFEKARASRDGGSIRLAFELRAGDYNGSTYELAHDSATDRLTGTYCQAVVKRTFAVTFARK
jgi:hypothetical protein